MHTHAQARLSQERLAAGLGWFSLALGTAELAAPRAVARLIGIPDDPRLVSVLRAFGAREIASGLGLLAQPDHAGWAWSRLGGDAIDLAFLGSAANEDTVNRQRVALAAAAVASITALDLICARGLHEEREQRRAAGGYIEDEVCVERAITVTRPIEEVFAFWKGYANLPRFMRHLTSVETLGEGRTRSHGMPRRRSSGRTNGSRGAPSRIPTSSTTAPFGSARPRQAVAPRCTCSCNTGHPPGAWGEASPGSSAGSPASRSRKT
jgi:hypothetical protein